MRENLTHSLLADVDGSKGIIFQFCFGHFKATNWEGKCLIKDSKTRSCLAVGWFIGSFCLKLIRLIYLTFLFSVDVFLLFVLVGFGIEAWPDIKLIFRCEDDWKFAVLLQFKLHIDWMFVCAHLCLCAFMRRDLFVAPERATGRIFSVVLGTKSQNHRKLAQLESEPA